MDRVRLARQGRDFLHLVSGPRRAAGPAPFVSAQCCLSRCSLMAAGLAVLAANIGQALRCGFAKADVAGKGTAATADAMVTATQASAAHPQGRRGAARTAGFSRPA